MCKRKEHLLSNNNPTKGCKIMNIKLKEVTVGELIEGYVDNKEDGVIGGR